MKWRTVGQESSDEDKPSLEAVLNHYGVRHSTTLRSQMTNCPFHEDRTPSLSVDLGKGVFHCHSCGAGGDSYALLMMKEGVSYQDARELAGQLGLSTEARQDNQRRGRFERPLPQRDRGSAGGGYVPRWRRGQAS